MTGPITSLTPAPIIGVTEPTSFSLPPGPPQHDVIELLPPAAAEKLRLLRQRRSDTHRLVPPFEQIRAASLVRIEAENALKRLTDHPQNFGRGLREDDPLVVAAKKHLDKMTDDFRRLTELQAIRSAAFQSAGSALANVEDWLKSGRPGNCQIEEVEIEPPKLLKGESILDAIERHRRRVRELRADQHRIASAPFPSTYARAQMRAQIEALAMQGAPDVSLTIEHDGDLAWPMTRVQSQVMGAERQLAFAELPDAVALVAWLHRDALIAALDREIASEADDKAALSHEARQKAEAEVMGDLLAIEREESTLVWQAQSENLPAEHRADVSVVALLSIDLVAAPRADASPETSPGFSWPLRR